MTKMQNKLFPQFSRKVTLYLTNKHHTISQRGKRKIYKFHQCE